MCHRCSCGSVNIPQVVNATRFASGGASASAAESSAKVRDAATPSSRLARTRLGLLRCHRQAGRGETAGRCVVPTNAFPVERRRGQSSEPGESARHIVKILCRQLLDSEIPPFFDELGIALLRNMTVDLHQGRRLRITLGPKSWPVETAGRI
jgi:hypothetical protein